MHVSDDHRGLYEKFRVQRTDGRDQPGEAHEGCRYFVLDLDHDRFALNALRAYSLACAEEHPVLAKDLRELLVARYGQADG